MYNTNKILYNAFIFQIVYLYVLSDQSQETVAPLEK